MVLFNYVFRLAVLPMFETLKLKIGLRWQRLQSAILDHQILNVYNSDRTLGATMKSNGSADGIAVKYGSNGMLMSWRSTVFGSGSDQVLSAFFDNQTNLVIAGATTSTPMYINHPNSAVGKVLW